MDVLFYLSISILIAVVFCYVAFIAKNNMQKSELDGFDLKMATVGTAKQKEQEKEVLSYQKKFDDFTSIFKSYGFASNVFAFMEKETLPDVWFKRFDLNARSKEVGLSGEADDMSVFSKQLAGFEKNKYVKSVSLLSSNLEESTKVDFTLSLVLDPGIFNYASESLLSTTTSQTEAIIQPSANK